uniref:Uncharacterized protein n=1 Tax=Oryza glumipatula TaxID=40148 RepID=A0A0D9YQX4_9ORYZ
MLAAVPDRPPLIRKRRVRPPPSKLEPRSHRPRSASRSVGGASWRGFADVAVHRAILLVILQVCWLARIRLSGTEYGQLGGRVPAPFQFQDVVPALLNYT